MCRTSARCSTCKGTNTTCSRNHKGNWLLISCAECPHVLFTPPAHCRDGCCGGHTNLKQPGRMHHASTSWLCPYLVAVLLGGDVALELQGSHGCVGVQRHVVPLCVQALLIAAQGLTVLPSLEGSVSQLALALSDLPLLHHPAHARHRRHTHACLSAHQLRSVTAAAVCSACLSATMVTSWNCTTQQGARMSSRCAYLSCLLLMSFSMALNSGLLGVRLLNSSSSSSLGHQSSHLS